MDCITAKKKKNLNFTRQPKKYCYSNVTSADTDDIKRKRWNRGTTKVSLSSFVDERSRETNEKSSSYRQQKKRQLFLLVTRLRTWGEY